MPYKPIIKPADKTSASGASDKGKTPFSRDTYLSLVQFFRDNPEPDYACFVAAGHACGCSAATAKRAWTRGWPSRVPPMYPIRDVLRAESEEARAQRAKIYRELKRNEAIKEVAVLEDGARVRLQEGLIVQATRSIAGKTLGQALRLATAAEALTESIAKQLHDEFIGTNQFGQEKASIEEKFRVLRDISTLAKESSRIATVAMELERKYMGQPEKIIGVENIGVEDAIDQLIKGMDELKSLRGSSSIQASDPEKMLLQAAVQNLDVASELESLKNPNKK